MKDNEYVKTAIRWRPTDENEVIIKKINEQAITFGSQTKTFCFDHVIDSSDQNEVYEILVKPLVGKALEGYDCTFLASGQTGSGKTYTMGFESNVNSENNGMTLRVLNSIFSYADAERVEVSISFVEVYNRTLGFIGTESTTAILKERIRDTENKIRESVFNLVDLAGSECIDKTGNTARESIVEGKNINESLSAFKRVIIAMSCGASHIPFRDSVITYILRKSLEIDCYLTLLGCVSPFQRDYGETLSTLNFVADAKLIKRTPQLNALINESQNLKTPAKMSFQTPTSSKRFTTSFNRPLPLSSIQNKLLLPPVPMSEPRYNQSIEHSSTLKRFGRKSIPNSTNKPMRQPFAVDRFKINNRVLPATASRKVSDSSLQNSEFKNSNFNEASTTSVVNIESPKKSSEGQHTTNTPEVNRIVERLAKEAKKIMDNGFNLNIIDVMGVALSKINDGNSTISGSFHSTPNQATMLSTVMENECCDDVTLKDEAMKDQIFSISSTEEPIIDPIPSLNVTISCDHEEKKILIEVSKSTNDNVTTIPTLPIVLPEIVSTEIASTEIASPDTTQEADVLINGPTLPIVSPEIATPDTTQEADVLINDLFDDKIEVSSGEFQGDPLNQTPTFVDDILNNKTMENTSPIMKQTTDTNMRTPIGKLVIRRVALANQFEATQYAVEIIHKVRKPQENIPEVSSSPPSIEMDYDYEVIEMPKIKKQLFSTSSPIVSEASHSANHFLNSPRLVLHRVNSIQDYKRHQQVPRQAVTKLKRKLPQMESARTIEVTPSPSPFFEMKYARIKNPNKNTHRSSTNSPVTNKVAHSEHHFPKQPRLVLHRVTIEDYLQQHRPQTVTKVKHKVSQTKSARTKCSGKKSKVQSKETDFNSRILEILNTENENGLRKQLATIGAKKAHQIFNYRTAKGKFKSLDGLLKMPFWSKKTHERFIANNIFV